jgi:hypothetical protein
MGVKVGVSGCQPQSVTFDLYLCTRALSGDICCFVCVCLVAGEAMQDLRRMMSLTGVLPSVDARIYGGFRGFSCGSLFRYANCSEVEFLILNMPRLFT